LREIVEIVNVDSEGVALTNTPFKWNATEDRFYFKKGSKLFQKIKERYGETDQELTQEFRRRSELLYKMYQQKIFKFTEVQEIINEYYKKPESILKKFNIA
jgi:phosphoenolpyruvate synthase/pyruvate phosphate dikinase